MCSIAGSGNLDSTLGRTRNTILRAHVRELIGNGCGWLVVGVERAVWRITSIELLCTSSDHGRVNAGHLGHPWVGEGTVDGREGEKDGLGSHGGRMKRGEVGRGYLKDAVLSVDLSADLETTWRRSTSFIYFMPASAMTCPAGTTFLLLKDCSLDDLCLGVLGRSLRRQRSSQRYRKHGAAGQEQRHEVQVTIISHDRRGSRLLHMALNRGDF